MNQDTTIGVYNDYERSYIITIVELAAEIKRSWTTYTTKQYCDWRYSTNLERFVYNPYTGEKIDWKEVRKLLEEYIKLWKIEK